MFDNGLEPDHRRQLRDSVADYVSRSANTKTLRADIAGSTGFSESRWHEMAGLGWASLLLPEAFDGLEMEVADLCALHAGVGRAVFPEPLAIVPLLAGLTVSKGDNAALAARVVPGMAAGTTIATLGWQSAAGAMGRDDVAIAARRTGARWLLNGQARFVPIANAASAMVVAARCDDGVALFWLDTIPAVSDVSRNADGSVFATVDIKNLEIGAEAIISGPERGGEILDAALDIARLAACAELLGIMEQVLEMTLEHLRQRQQFGKPIGSFQALQHRAVDLYMQIELSRSTIGRAAEAFDTDAASEVRSIQVSAAKSRCGDAARTIVREAIQMHGAIGYTSEYDLSLYANRVLTLSAWLGNSASHRNRWAQLSLATEAGQ